jgi:hypothetical protein
MRDPPVGRQTRNCIDIRSRSSEVFSGWISFGGKPRQALEVDERKNGGQNKNEIDSNFRYKLKMALILSRDSCRHSRYQPCMWIIPVSQRYQLCLGNPCAFEPIKEGEILDLTSAYYSLWGPGGINGA